MGSLWGRLCVSQVLSEWLAQAFPPEHGSHDLKATRTPFYCIAAQIAWLGGGALKNLKEN